MKPIAITGKFRSGKDVIAAHLVERYGYTRFAFGDGIRDVCRRLYPDHFRDGTKPRALLQGVGQVLRTFDEDVWVHEVFAAIKSTVNWTGAPIRPVISDLRQPNEYDRCRAEGYVLLRVTRPDSDRLATAATTDNFDDSAVTHETESYVDQFTVDYDVMNDGSVADLLRKVDEVMTKINGGVR